MFEQLTLMKFIVLFVVLAATTRGTHSMHYIFDVRFQDEWTGTCANGLMQSPIAIPNVKDRQLTKFMQIQFTNMEIPIREFEITNAARHTTFEWSRGGKLPERFFVLNTTQNVKPFHAHTPYVLQNFHVHHNLDPHTGTNHALNGSIYAMEMHFVFVLQKFNNDLLAAFEAGPGNTLEIAVLWRLSDVKNKPWSRFNKLMLSKKLAENETISALDMNIPLTDLMPRSSTFSLYHGSMLFYRCLEVNTWIVFDEVMDFDTSDLGMRYWTYESDGNVIPLHRNIRHIQSLNGRPVYHGIKQEVVHNVQKRRDTIP